MKKKTLSILTLAAAALLAITGCRRGGGEPEIVPGSLEYEDGTQLRLAAGYNDKLTGISFHADTVGSGLTLADGKTYHTGDLKPTWAHLKDKLKIDFVDKFTGAGSADNEWKVWENKLNEVDIVAGGVSSLTAAGAQGKLIDLAQYLDQMPAFKYYLEQNPIARLSITGAKTGGLGAIYFSPYFDGNDDIERMPLMRADLVEKLLDDSTFTGANRAITSFYYEPYMPKTGTIDVRSVKSDGTVVVVTKDYSKYGNIIDQMNKANGLTGSQALAMFKEYIRKTYNGYYTKLSDLFLGYDAAWDADEMVALFRIAHAQLNDLDGNPLVPLFARETGTNQRDIDLFRFAGSLFGVRGMESRSDYLYFKNDGKLYDARSDADAYRAVERMNALTREGLVTVTGSGKSNNYLQKDAGLMSYDYNQTQTALNDTLKINGTVFKDTGRKYRAVMVPVAKWNDGEEKYMRFTESWRSVKTDGWAISAAGVAGNQNKLNAALTLIDYAFSIQGQITMSYGPDSFIKVKSGWDDTKTITKWSQVAEKYETFDFNGQQMPIISDGCRANLYDANIGNLNYTNFARRYLGSTLNGFPKSQAFEYQCTTDTGKEGAAIMSAAIKAEVIKHPELRVNTANMWYTSIPTTLPVTAAQQSLLDEYTNLTNKFSSAKNKTNVFYQIIKGGYAETGVGPTNPTAETFAQFVSSSWSGSAYLQVRNAQWRTLYAYYQTI